jgi:hypothetical protein
MKVVCLHSVLEHQQQQLDLPYTLTAAQLNGKAVHSVSEGGMDRPSQNKYHLAGSLSSSQPGGLRVGSSL